MREPKRAAKPASIPKPTAASVPAPQATPATPVAKLSTSGARQRISLSNSSSNPPAATSASIAAAPSSAAVRPPSTGTSRRNKTTSAKATAPQREWLDLEPQTRQPVPGTLVPNLTEKSEPYHLQMRFDIDKVTVETLKAALEARGEKTDGVRADLAERLKLSWQGVDIDYEEANRDWILNQAQFEPLEDYEQRDRSNHHPGPSSHLQDSTILKTFSSDGAALLFNQIWDDAMIEILRLSALDNLELMKQKANKSAAPTTAAQEEEELSDSLEDEDIRHAEDEVLGESDHQTPESAERYPNDDQGEDEDVKASNGRIKRLERLLNNPDKFGVRLRLYLAAYFCDVALPTDNLDSQWTHPKDMPPHVTNSPVIRHLISRRHHRDLRAVLSIGQDQKAYEALADHLNSRFSEVYSPLGPIVLDEMGIPFHGRSSPAPVFGAPVVSVPLSAPATTAPTTTAPTTTAPSANAPSFPPPTLSCPFEPEEPAHNPLLISNITIYQGDYVDGFVVDNRPLVGKVGGAIKFFSWPADEYIVKAQVYVSWEFVNSLIFTTNTGRVIGELGSVTNWPGALAITNITTYEAPEGWGLVGYNATSRVHPNPYYGAVLVDGFVPIWGNLDHNASKPTPHFIKSHAMSDKNNVIIWLKPHFDLCVAMKTLDIVKSAEEFLRRFSELQGVPLIAGSCYGNLAAAKYLQEMGRPFCLSLESSAGDRLMKRLIEPLEDQQARAIQLRDPPRTRGLNPITIMAYCQKRLNSKRNAIVVINNMWKCEFAPFETFSKPKAVLFYAENMDNVDLADQRILSILSDRGYQSWRLSAIHWLLALTAHNCCRYYSLILNEHIDTKTFCANLIWGLLGSDFGGQVKDAQRG